MGLKNISIWISNIGEEYYRISIGCKNNNYHKRFKKSEYSLTEIIKLRNEIVKTIHGDYGVMI